MPRGAQKKENPRRAVTYKLPPALLDRIAREHKRRGFKDRTEFVERALWAALDAAAPERRPARDVTTPEPVEPPQERANAPQDLAARTAAFRAATSR